MTHAMLMDPRLQSAGKTSIPWRVLSTPPMTGEANMAFDRETLAAIESGDTPPTLRFFRFSKPTLTYGRLQTLPSLSSLVPPNWPAVQRPTGGGIVFHENDLCLSLCWPKGMAGIPTKPSDQYRWIHERILNALRSSANLRMAACCDTPTPQTAPTSFQLRQCFNDPVGYDLLEGSEKRVGGALLHHRGAVLYQGSIQMAGQDLENRIHRAFE